MASGTIYGSTNNEYIESKIVWSSKADPDTNTSAVTATLYYRRTNEYTTYGRGWFTITIGGVSIGPNSANMIINTDWVKAIEGTATITHDADGSKSITIKATGDISGTTLNSTNCSGTAVLDKIPRETLTNSFTCSTSYLDGTLTYKYTSQTPYYIKANISLNLNGNYIRIRSINHGKKTAGVQQTQNVDFTASELSAIYNDLPAATKGTIRVTIRTYYDADYSQEATDPTYKEISLTIPTSIKPTVTLTVTPVNSNSWIRGKGIYVAGYSGLTASFSAVQGEGATAASSSISGGDYKSDTNTLTVDKITDPGQLTLTGKSTDSRGRSGSASKTITVEPYSIPAVASLTVARGTYANSKWTADDNGADVRVVFKTTLALTNYSNNYKATFALDGAAITPNAGTTTGLVSGTAYTVYFLNIESESSHSLKITTTDAVGRAGSATITVATVNVTIEFNESGKGIAFGKTSEKDAFECAWDAEFSGALRKIQPDGTALEIDDTGWIELGTSDAVTTEGAGTGRNGPGCFYRVVNGNHVYVAFCVLFTYAGAAIQINANAIPSKFRPARKAYTLNTIGGYRLARVGVNGSGNVVIDWAQDLINGGVQTTSTPSIWIDGYVDYWLD